MVMTKPELVSALQNEVRILLHLASKIDRANLEYRPTPKQRSIVELLKYLSMMGPALVQAAKAGAFDGAAWTAAEQAAAAQSYDQTLAAIAAQPATYAALLADVSDDDLRAEIDPFGAGKSSRGAFLVTPGPLRLRGLSHAAVPVPQGLRTRRAQYLEPVGGHGRAAERLSDRRADARDSASGRAYLGVAA